MMYKVILDDHDDHIELGQYFRTQAEAASEAAYHAFETTTITITPVKFECELTIRDEKGCMLINEVVPDADIGRAVYDVILQAGAKRGYTVKVEII